MGLEQDAKHEEHAAHRRELVDVWFAQLRSAGAFEIGGSPLLNSWHDFIDDDDIAEGGLASNPADDVVLHARWESDGDDYEEIVTVGDLIAARIEDGQLVFERAGGERVEVRAYRLDAMSFCSAAPSREAEGGHPLAHSPSCRPRGG